MSEYYPPDETEGGGMFFITFTALATGYCTVAALIDGFSGGNWWPIHMVCAFVCASCLADSIERRRR